MQIAFKHLGKGCLINLIGCGPVSYTHLDVLEGKSLDSVDYTEVRGTEGIKEAVYHIGGMDVKVAAVSGLNNANEVLEKVRKGEADYHFIEIMCCPGGCVNGGGQPIQSATVRSFTDLKGLRAKACLLYTSRCV